MLLIITGCNSIHITKLLSNGKVAQQEFKVNIPFEYRLGLMVLKVNIEGEEYDFLLDIGFAWC